MFGKMFKKATDAASQVAGSTEVELSEETGEAEVGVSVSGRGLASAARGLGGAARRMSNAVRGVEEVDWIHHAFPYSYELELFDEDARDIRRPQPPAGLDPAAFQYADTWYNIWAPVRDGHITPVSAVEAGDVAGANAAVVQWQQDIEAANTAQAQLGDFRGARTLVLANSDVYETLGAMVSLVREYIGARLQGGPSEDLAFEAIERVLSIHMTMNESLASFYADPTGAAAQAAEDAAFAPIEAMRQSMMGDPSAPELQPINGVSLHDYVAGSAKINEGWSNEQVAAVLGVERPQWEQANAGWVERMQTHMMTVGMQYSSLMSTPHPLFEAAAAAGAGPGAGSQASRLKTDRDFYIECAAVMAAAQEAGVDPSGYLEANYQVTTTQVAGAGVQWMQDLRNADQLITLQQAKQREFASVFAQQMGPGIADDIVF
ncbi:DUF6620 family protein [Actinomyces howellii]|uniref:Uncharacterized protein n=1 Tax=Actinomyces howellii TaxID=52771 RepID=A0A3S5EH26_9ACTO|nr:DUF6620 family protein [Actinomyces howellii]VEG28433.1 Uncharacterised protein [Actinomyces howellii]